LNANSWPSDASKVPSADASTGFRCGGAGGSTRPEGDSSKERDVRIVVDLNRCQGYAQCVPLAPDVLKLLGEEALAYDPNPDDSQRQRVVRAAASCPVQAILVELDLPEEAAAK
jgi:ferredoxin